MAEAEKMGVESWSYVLPPLKYCPIVYLELPLVPHIKERFSRSLILCQVDSAWNEWDTLQTVDQRRSIGKLLLMIAFSPVSYSYFKASWLGSKIMEWLARKRLWMSREWVTRGSENSLCASEITVLQESMRWGRANKQNVDYFQTIHSLHSPRRLYLLREWMICSLQSPRWRPHVQCWC